MAMRRAVPPPARPHAIPSSAVTISKATCGLQKQFCPGQACSVLYGPIASSPPSALMTVQSAVMNIHRNPNHRAATIAASEATVSALSNRELNRLASIHPMTPTSVRGGGNRVVPSPSGAGLERGGAASAMLYPPVNRMCRLYRLPIKRVGQGSSPGRPPLSAGRWTPPGQAVSSSWPRRSGRRIRWPRPGCCSWSGSGTG